MRAIYLKQAGQDILVETCADNQVSDDNDAYTSNFTFSQLPEATQEIRAYIEAHAYVDLSLYAVDEANDQVRLRTPAEMDALPHCPWQRKLKMVE